MFNNEHQIKYSEAVRQAITEGLDAFQSWFNKSRDVRQSVIRGYWDLTIHTRKETRTILHF